MEPSALRGGSWPFKERIVACIAAARGYWSVADDDAGWPERLRYLANYSEELVLLERWKVSAEELNTLPEAMVEDMKLVMEAERLAESERQRNHARH